MLCLQRSARLWQVHVPGLDVQPPMQQNGFSSPMALGHQPHQASPQSGGAHSQSHTPTGHRPTCLRNDVLPLSAACPQQRVDSALLMNFRNQRFPLGGGIGGGGMNGSTHEFPLQTLTRLANDNALTAFRIARPAGRKPRSASARRIHAVLSTSPIAPLGPPRALPTVAAGCSPPAPHRWQQQPRPPTSRTPQPPKAPQQQQPQRQRPQAPMIPGCLVHRFSRHLRAKRWARLRRVCKRCGQSVVRACKTLSRPAQDDAARYVASAVRGFRADGNV